MNILIQLFISFLKIGAFSFGGGYAMLPLIRKELMDIHNWVNPGDFIDILAISQMTPGPIAINSATFLGYRVAGIMGSVVASIAVVIPSIIVVLTILHFINKFNETDYIKWAFEGIKPVVIGLITSAAVLVAKDVLIDIKSIIIMAMIFYLVTFKKMHPILAIIVAGISGVIVF